MHLVVYHKCWCYWVARHFKLFVGNLALRLNLSEILSRAYKNLLNFFYLEYFFTLTDSLIQYSTVILLIDSTNRN